MIDIKDSAKIDMRVGTIIKVSINKRARKKVYKLKIDLERKVSNGFRVF